MVKHRSRSKLKSLCTLIVLIIVPIIFVAYNFATKSYSGQPVTIFIPRDATYASIADTLTKYSGQPGSNAAMLLEYRGCNTSRLRGAYTVTPGMDAIDIYRMVSRNHQSPVRLTFNNLRTLTQLADRVSTVIDITPDQFLHAVDSVLSDIPAAERPAYFMPDTYDFYWTASPAKVVNTLVGHYRQFWNETRARQARALGLTPLQLTTVASIAEEETNDTAERGIVGQLYINRLNRNMPLQADPTVKFAVGDFGLRRILNKHLATESPYNTYLNPGLPPGPIRLVSASTVDAILNTPRHDYLYMCAKEDFSGRHNFTSSYPAHLANAARYHQALNKLNK